MGFCKKPQPHAFGDRRSLCLQQGRGRATQQEKLTSGRRRAGPHTWPLRPRIHVTAWASAAAPRAVPRVPFSLGLRGYPSPSAGGAWALIRVDARPGEESGRMGTSLSRSTMLCGFRRQGQPTPPVAADGPSSSPSRVSAASGFCQRLEASGLLNQPHSVSAECLRPARSPAGVREHPAGFQPPLVLFPPSELPSVFPTHSDGHTPL